MAADLFIGSDTITEKAAMYTTVSSVLIATDGTDAMPMPIDSVTKMIAFTFVGIVTVPDAPHSRIALPKSLLFESQL